MKKLLLIVILFLPLINASYSVFAEDGNSLTLMKDETSISITKSGTDYAVQITNENSFVSNSVMFSTTFESIANQLVETWPQSGSENGIWVNLTYGDIHLSGFLDPNQTSHQESYGVVLSIFSRYTGEEFENAQVWPVDFSLAILESYPEQYQVSTIIQRTPDLLAVVYEFNVYLLIWSLNEVSNLVEKQMALDPQQALHAEEISGAINSGGDNLRVDFPIFSVGEDFRPEDLVFGIFIDFSGAMLVFGDTPYGVMLNSSSSILISPIETPTNLASFPYLGVFAVILVIFPLAKKKSKPLL